jgi:hypothetical protein
MRAAIQNLLSKALIVVASTASLALAGCAGQYKSMSDMDANDRCIMQHTWDTTVLSGSSPLICPGWYLERRAKDGAK